MTNSTYVTGLVDMERTTGPVVLTADETGFFDRLRGALQDGSLSDSKVADVLAPFERSGLPKNFWGFGLTLYQPGRPRLMVVRATATPAFENIRQTVTGALAHPRIGEFDMQDRDHCRVQFDFIVDEPAPVDFASLSESALDANRFEFGIDGLRIVGPEQRRYILPGDGFVSSILGLGQLRRRVERLFPDTPIDQLEFFRFQSVSFVSTADGWIRLYRGYPAVTPATKETISAAAAAGVGWIVNNRHSDGRFVYYYDGATDSHRDHEHPTRDPDTNPYYNLLRHCGGVITVLHTHTLHDTGDSASGVERPDGIAGVSFDPVSREAIESGIDFFIQQLVPYTAPNGKPAAYAHYNQKGKLGGSGIGLYMLALYQRLFRSPKYAEHARLLANHLVNEILDSGEFRYYHVYLDRKVTEAENRSLFSFYYPGEAVIGLANYCQHVCESEAQRDAIYARVHESLRFLFIERPRIYREHYTSLPADSWLMMGINDLWDTPEFRRKLYSDPVFQDADQMVDHMYAPRRAPYPDYAGSFFYQFGDHPYPDGARAEGLLAAYLLARKVGDGQRIARYDEALRLVAWATLRLCNTRESVYSVPNPKRAVGGIRFKLTRQWFRVDTIQHVASFYLKFLPYFEKAPEPPAKGSCDTATQDEASL